MDELTYKLISASIKRPVENEALSKPTKTDNALRRLAKAIIVQACDDKNKAVDDMKKHPEGSEKYIEAADMLEECKQFFVSDWCKRLMEMRYR